MADAPRRLTCVIADDHPLMVDSLTRLLEAGGIAVLAVATDGEAAVAAIKRHKPRVAIVDVRMPGLTGVEVARRVRLDTSVVLYTGHRDKALVIDGLDAGIRAFVLKEAPPADLLRAIDIAASTSIRCSWTSSAAPRPPRPCGCSHRENETCYACSRPGCATATSASGSR
jgi:DNA-binding NarL/FixJ family response regulator